MSAKSKDVGRDIAKLALADARFDTDTLEEVFAYCWDQLCWRKTDADLIALRDRLPVEGSESCNASALLEALKAIDALPVLEINQYNYDHDDVCELNENAMQASLIARAAIAKATGEAL